MRAVGFSTAGGPDVLEVVDVPVREAGPGEVRIAVSAAAVNPTDLLTRERGGQGPAPWILGMDAAGVIESVGPDVERLHIGDEVMAGVNPRRPEGGAQSSLIVVPAASVVAIPQGATLAQASTLPMNGLTALLGLELLDLAPGANLAVTGGPGLLGSYVIGLAREQGLRVIADAKPEDEELVRGFGADVVVPRGDEFTAAVREATDGGADGLFDTALLKEKAFGALRDGGVVVDVRGWEPESTERGIEVRQVFVNLALERTEWLERLRELATDGRLTLRVAATVPPERASETHELMGAGGLRGRAVITF